jgi:hypothetical protein
MRNSRPMIIDAMIVMLFAIAMFVIIAAAGSQANAAVNDNKFKLGIASPSTSYSKLFKRSMKTNKKRDKKRRQMCR